MILNIRGCNGSGKSTLARALVDGAHPANIVELVNYETPALKLRTVIGYWSQDRSIIAVGKYETACGGMDSIPNTDLAKKAVWAAAEKAGHVVAEGILPSTVYQTWADFGKETWEKLHQKFCFLYLQTPLVECLRRIQARNGGKPIKEQLVADKVRAVKSTRAKAIKDGFRVFDLPVGFETEACLDILMGNGEKFLGKN